MSVKRRRIGDLAPGSQAAGKRSFISSFVLECVLTIIRHYSLPCKASKCNCGRATEGRGDSKGHRDTRSHDGASAGTLKCSGT
jgi:hypothetical protein